MQHPTRSPLAKLSAVAAAATITLGLLGTPAAADTVGTGDQPQAVPAIDVPAPVMGTDAPTGDPGPQPLDLPSGWPFWELQMNLCNSGLAGCYEGGQAIPEGADQITANFPDLVTLNEVCLGDVSGPLYTAMREAWGQTDGTFWAFMPAINAQTLEPFECANGDQYGNGIVGRGFTDGSAPTIAAFGNIYPLQDASSDEWRSWLCVAVNGSYWGCTTHLTSQGGSLAMDQCVHLMSTVIPDRWSVNGYLPTVVGGDLNLTHGILSNPDVQDCVPGGWFRKGDGDVQHVMYTNDFTFGFSDKFDMEHTDHPAWLVTATAP